MFPVSDVIPARGTPFVTLGIISLTTLAFIYELRLDDDDLQHLIAVRGVVPAAFSWPDVLTSMFLHAGWLHLLGNLLYLWIFGENVEDRVGHLGFAAFYLFCGTAAALGHVWVTSRSLIPLVGASGAVAGVMGAYFALYPHSRVLTAVFIIFYLDVIEVPAIFFLAIWFVIQLFSGVGSLGAHAAGGAAAFWANVAGFAAGLSCGAISRFSSGARRWRWD